MSEESDQAREMEFLCKELERHGVYPVDTNWECLDSSYAYPSGYVNLRELARILDAWKNTETELIAMMTTVDNNITRMTGLLEDVRTGRRTPDSLPPLGVNLTRPTPRPVPQTDTQTPARMHTQWGSPPRRRLKTFLDFMGDTSQDIARFFKVD